MSSMNSHHVSFLQSVTETEVSIQAIYHTAISTHNQIITASIRRKVGLIGLNLASFTSLRVKVNVFTTAKNLQSRPLA